MLRNPLASILADRSVDNVCSTKGPQLFGGAGNVRTGRISVFSVTEISDEALMGSSCLPTLFQVVEIHYPLSIIR